MINFLDSEIKSFDATIIKSKANKLSESDKKVLDTLEKFNDFLKSYSKMSINEQKYLSNLIGQITYKVGSLTILVNK